MREALTTVRQRLATAWLADLLLFVCFAVAFTWPLILHPSQYLVAPAGTGDPYLNLWILGWDLQTLTTHPSAFVTGSVFNTNIFHPATNTLAYSDNFLIQSVLVWPLFALTHDLILCYNVLLLVSLVADAMAMYLLVRAITGSRGAALVSGLIWGFWPYHVAHLRQLQLQALYFIPLAFLFLFRLVKTGRLRDAVGLGGATALQTISAVYYGVMLALALSAAGLVSMLARQTVPRRRLLFGFILAAAVAVVAVAPVAWKYRSVEQQGFVRDVYETSQHSAIWQSYLWAPSGYWLYDRLGLTRLETETDTFERQLFPGLMVLLLAGAGLFAARERLERQVVATMAALMIVGFVLSLGPPGAPWLYAAIRSNLPGFQAIRVPARFVVLVVFGLAVLAGFGVRRTAEMARGNRSLGRVLSGLIVCAVVAEYAHRGLPAIDAPQLRTAAGAWLAQHSAEPGAAIYLPLYPDSRNTRAMLASLEHRRPIVNGHSGNRPPFFLALVDSLQLFPSDDSLALLHDLGVRFIITPAPLAGEAVPGLLERARFPDNAIYELVWSDSLESEWLSRQASPLPPAGRPPYRSDETAVYEMTWETGPGKLLGPAGTFTIAGSANRSVDPPCTTGDGQPDLVSPGDAPQVLTVFAQTADWVSTVFEAQDCFTSWTTAAFEPLLVRQKRREGRRKLDLEYAYDWARQEMRIRGQFAVKVRTGTRDPLSALYYIRTLPLKPGDEVTVPIIENARKLRVQVKATGMESIVAAGQAVNALRLELAILYTVQTRPPMRITIWLSDDERRLPVQIHVATDFGSFRGQLVSFRASP